MPDRERGPEEHRRPEAIVVDRDDVEILFDGPVTQGALAPAARGGPLEPGRDPRGAVAVGEAPMHGRMMRPGEARPIPAEAMGSLGEAFGRFVEGLEGAEDVITDEQAMALARRNMDQRLDALAHAPGVDPLMIEGGAPGVEPLMVEGPRGASLPVARGPGVALEPAAVTNLPSLINRPPARRGAGWVDGQALLPIRWEQIYGTPGYLQQMIRAFGRELFRTFPCFAAHERAAAQGGRDALGELHVLANLGGAGPNLQSELDQAATWVRANGVPIDATTFDFPHMPGYNPSVVLAADANRSYLLVHESVDMGAPLDSMYVYSWPGGMDFYKDKLPAQERVAVRVLAGAPQRQAIAAPARPGQPRQVGFGGGVRAALGRVMGGRQEGRYQAPVDHGIQRMGRAPQRQIRDDGPGRDALDATMQVPALPDAGRVRRERDARRPVAAAQVTTSSLTDALVGMGFRRGGSPEGPVLRMKGDDGREVVARGVEPNVPLHQAASMRLVIRDEGGSIIAEDVIASREDVEAMLAGPAPRP